MNVMDCYQAYRSRFGMSHEESVKGAVRLILGDAQRFVRFGTISDADGLRRYARSVAEETQPIAHVRCELGDARWPSREELEAASVLEESAVATMAVDVHFGSGTVTVSEELQVFPAG